MGLVFWSVLTWKWPVATCGYRVLTLRLVQTEMGSKCKTGHWISKTASQKDGEMDG